MTGIAAHVSGLIRLSAPSRPQVPQALSDRFGELLAPNETVLGGDGEAAACAFNAKGLFGARAVHFASDGAPSAMRATAAALTTELDTPRPLPLAITASVSCTSEADHKQPFSAGHEHAPLLGSRGAVPGEAALTASIGGTIASPASTLADTSKDATAVRQAVGGSPAQPPRRSASQAQATVQLSVSTQGSLAAVTVRGEVPRAELEARLKQALAEYGLDLASLRLNGIDHPFTEHRIAGGSNGNR